MLRVMVIKTFSGCSAFYIAPVLSHREEKLCERPMTGIRSKKSHTLLNACYGRVPVLNWFLAQESSLCSQEDAYFILVL